MVDRDPAAAATDIIQISQLGRSVIHQSGRAGQKKKKKDRYTTDTFTTLELQNPSNGVSEHQK